jgi:hypothetical protein
LDCFILKQSKRLGENLSLVKYDFDCFNMKQSKRLDTLVYNLLLSVTLIVGKETIQGLESHSV